MPCGPKGWHCLLGFSTIFVWIKFKIPQATEKINKSTQAPKDKTTTQEYQIYMEILQ